LLGVSVLKLFVTLALAISCKSVYLKAHQPVVKPYPKINTKSNIYPFAVIRWRLFSRLLSLVVFAYFQMWLL